jgi:hypothetical protein
MAGLNVQEVVDLGGCNAVINGVNVGHFDENGLKASVKSTVIEAFAAKYGMQAVKRFLNGQTIDLEGELIQTSFGNLAEALPGATKVTDGSGDSKLTFGQIGGTEIPAVTLVLTSFLSGNTPTYDLTLKVTPVGDFELLYSGNGIQKWKVKWSGVVNEASGDDGSYSFQFGDSTITPDVTPPTVSAVTPLNAATGVSVGSSVVWTISEELNSDTVSDETVLLFKDAAGPTGLQVAGAVTLVNNGASTQITFNPTSNLDASSDYVAVLNGVQDKAGNALAFYVNQFQTA